MNSDLSSHNSLGKLIHVGSIYQHNKRQYVYLRQKNSQNFVWTIANSNGTELETDCIAPSIPLAIRQAINKWKQDYFQTIHAGFRYTLPERDEIGSNALFFQMILSYESSNGIYFDENLGHYCIVSNASSEALELYHRLKKTQRL